MHRVLGLVGYPPEQDFANTVSSNIIMNCPVTFRDIHNAHNIFDPDVPSMKGKSVKRQQESVVRNYVKIPKGILEINTNLEVSVDGMFVKRFLFLVSASKKLKFSTIEYIPKRSEKNLDRYVNKILDVYKIIWNLSLTV